MTSSGALPYHKGRVVGTFDVYALSDGRVRVEVAARFGSTEYFGRAWFTERGAATPAEHDCTSFRTRKLEDATRAATKGLTEAAQWVARAWAEQHPEAFVEADLEAARADLARADAEIAALREQLAAAERRASSAMARVRVLGGCP